MTFPWYLRLTTGAITLISTTYSRKEFTDTSGRQVNSYTLIQRSSFWKLIPKKYSKRKKMLHVQKGLFHCYYNKGETNSLERPTTGRWTTLQPPKKAEHKDEAPNWSSCSHSCPPQLPAKPISTPQPERCSESLLLKIFQLPVAGCASRSKTQSSYNDL